MRKGLFHLPVMTTDREFVSQTLSNEIKDIYDGKSIAWYSKNPIVRHPGTLISAYYGMTAFPNRDILDFADDVIFFGDSGGYQLGTLGTKYPDQLPKLKEKLSPAKVLQWQESVCDIGMTLDVPLKRDFPYYSPDEFLHAARESKLYGDIMRANQTNEKFQLFNVIHGRTIEEMETWRTITEADYTFDGHSLAAQRSLETLALNLGYAIEHFPNTPFHILGASKTQACILMAHANTYTKSTIYYDSSTYIGGRSFRRYESPFNYGGVGFTMLQDDDHPNGDQISTMFCDCPICHPIKDRPNLLWDSGTKSGALCSLHNLYWQITYGKMTEAISENKNTDGWNSFMANNASEKTRKYIRFLDDVHDKGLEDAYCIHFKQNTDNLGEWY